MNKADLVAKIAGDNGLSKVAAEKALNSAIAGISGALKKDDSVTLIGFGTFSVSKRAVRKGRSFRMDPIQALHVGLHLNLFECRNPWETPPPDKLQANLAQPNQRALNLI